MLHFQIIINFKKNIPNFYFKKILLNLKFDIFIIIFNLKMYIQFDILN